MDHHSHWLENIKKLKKYWDACLSSSWLNTLPKVILLVKFLFAVRWKRQNVYVYVYFDLWSQVKRLFSDIRFAWFCVVVYSSMKKGREKKVQKINFIDVRFFYYFWWDSLIWDSFAMLCLFKTTHRTKVFRKREYFDKSVYNIGECKWDESWWNKVAVINWNYFDFVGCLLLSIDRWI